MNNIHIENMRKSKMNLKYKDLLEKLCNIHSLSISINTDGDSIDILKNISIRDELKEMIIDDIIYNMKELNNSSLIDEILSSIGIINFEIDNIISKLDIIYLENNKNDYLFSFKESSHISKKEFDFIIDVFDKLETLSKYNIIRNFELSYKENDIYSIRFNETLINEYMDKNIIKKSFLENYNLQNDSRSDLGILNNLKNIID